MKKSVNKILLGSTTLLAMGATAHQAQAATGAVGIDAIILAPITVTPVARLNFGVLTDTGPGGTATVDTADTLSGTTGATSAAGGTVTSGTFNITGSTGNQINITTPATVNITETVGGIITMAVNSFSILAPAAGGGGNNTGTAGAGANLASTLTASPANGYALGGTLVVGAGQAGGTYAGSVTVTAVYN